MSTPRDIHGTPWYKMPKRFGTPSFIYGERKGLKPPEPDRGSIKFSPIPNPNSRRRPKASSKSSHLYPGFKKRERNRKRKAKGLN